MGRKSSTWRICHRSSWSLLIWTPLSNQRRIVLSNEEMKKLWIPWKKALIVTLLGRSAGYRVLYQRMKQRWNLQGEFEAVDIGHDYDLVSFQSKEDYHHVLLDGPWIVLGYYLTFQKWKPIFRAVPRLMKSRLP